MRMLEEHDRSINKLSLFRDQRYCPPRAWQVPEMSVRGRLFRDVYPESSTHDSNLLDSSFASVEAVACILTSDEGQNLRY